MLCLGIETSCDESAIAVLDITNGSPAKILAEEISSQSEVHEVYGGVVPELASREHLRNLPIILDNVLARAEKSLNEMDLIAVTRGPGLLGCLLVGLNFAQGLSLATEIPVLGINHIEGHILAGQLDNPELTFPYIALVVSGGHTEIIAVHALGRYEVIARTLDDAAGEAFDKAAHIMGFSYPGGAKLADLADQGSKSSFKLPRVMRESPGFSFSGLKTAISMLVDKNREAMKTDSNIAASIAWTIQDSIIDALIFKLKQAISDSGFSRVLVTGGVSANKELRKRVSALKNVSSYFPSLSHCTDNAAMIAFAGALRFMKGDKIISNSEAIARWPVEQLGVS